MGGGGSSTTVQKADPWSGVQPQLLQGVGEAQRLFEQGGFRVDPYQGQRVTGFSPMTEQGFSMQRDVAMGPQASTTARNSLVDLMGSEYRDLDGVRSEILGGAIPAAVAQFSGNGMTDSSTAQMEVGRAATQALAPFEYDAFNRLNENRLRGAALAPSLDAAAYMPGQVMQGMGQQHEALAQQHLNANMQQYMEGQTADMDALNRYSALLMGYGGQGGQSSMSQPGANPIGQAAGAGLMGLGTYGMMMANPATAPFAIPAGLLGGAMGLFR